MTIPSSSVPEGNNSNILIKRRWYNYSGPLIRGIFGYGCITKIICGPRKVGSVSVKRHAAVDNTVLNKYCAK